MEGKDVKTCVLYFLPEIVSFLLALTQVFEEATTNLYLVFATCEKLFPHKTDCGTDSQDDDAIQVGEAIIFM